LLIIRREQSFSDWKPIKGLAWGTKWRDCYKKGLKRSYWTIKRNNQLESQTF
jgi:hypothetical protein